MNERDYFIIENIFIISSVLVFIIGLFLLQTFHLEYNFNVMFLLTVFIILFLFGCYFRLKRYQYTKYMMIELDRYKNEVNNNHGENNS